MNLHSKKIRRPNTEKLLKKFRKWQNQQQSSILNLSASDLEQKTMQIKEEFIYYLQNKSDKKIRELDKSNEVDKVVVQFYDENKNKNLEVDEDEDEEGEENALNEYYHEQNKFQQEKREENEENQVNEENEENEYYELDSKRRKYLWKTQIRFEIYGDRCYSCNQYGHWANDGEC